MAVEMSFSALATIVGTVITMMALAYGYGKNKAERESLHKDMKQAHRIMHNDLRSIDENSATSNKACPMCKSAD